jgi:hypothetical protein
MLYADDKSRAALREDARKLIEGEWGREGQQLASSLIEHYSLVPDRLEDVGLFGNPRRIATWIPNRRYSQPSYHGRRGFGRRKFLSKFSPLWAKKEFPKYTVAALTFAGFLLRLLCARSDLWLDEIWSLQNLEHIHHAGEIFYAISQDNNHVLNSLWLYLVGAQAPPQIIRLQAVVLGSLTIPVAAKLALRAGQPAAIAAAALVAFGMIFVHYGSEARGYAGFLLMFFCAAEALENFCDNPRSAKSRVAFALATACGALFHLEMIEAAGVLVLATVSRIALRTNSLRAITIAGIDLGIAAGLGLVPALATVVAGALYKHTIQLGTAVPFSFHGLTEGLAGLSNATLGFTLNSSPGFTLAIAVIWCGLALFLVPADRRIVPAFALFLPPALASLARFPNVHIPRFHLIATLGLVLICAEIVAHLWQRRQMIFACALLSVILVGNAWQIQALLAHGRGDYRAMIALMEAEGAATYGSNMAAELSRTIRFYDRDFGGRLAEIGADDWCVAPPRWYILSDRPNEEAESRSFGPPGCTAVFELRQVLIPGPLSGLRLALFRRRGS